MRTSPRPPFRLRVPSHPMAGTAWGLSHLPLNFVRGDTWGWFVVALGLGGVAGLFGREPKAKAQLKEKMFLVPFRVSGNIHLMRISKDGKKSSILSFSRKKNYNIFRWNSEWRAKSKERQYFQAVDSNFNGWLRPVPGRNFSGVLIFKTMIPQIESPPD